MHYYIAPWEWVTDDTGAYWRAPVPEHHAGTVDLRALPQMAKAGGAPEGYGLFAYRQQVSIAGSVYLGADGERARNLTEAAAALGVPSLNANSPGEVAWEMLTTHADPTGQTRCKPLRGDRTHPVRLRIGGQLVREEPCTGDHLTRTEAVFQADYKRNRQAVTDGKLALETVQKWVGYTMQALRGEQSDAVAQELVPSPYKSDDPLWRKPETTITDNFNRASLGSNWTVEGASDWSIITSTTIRGNDASDIWGATCRHNTNLSSDEHYTQIDVVAVEDADRTMTPCTRVADVDNGYHVFNRETGALHRIEKIVAGTRTTIADLGGGIAPPFTIRLTSDASDDHTSTVDGVDAGSVNDTSITGNVIVGLGCHTLNYAEGDNFEAADLAAGDPAIVGDVTFTLTPAAAMAVDRDLVGSITHTLTPAAQMAVGRAILGDLTFTLTPAADMSQADANAITGDVAFDLVPAAALAVGRALTGDVTHTLNVTAAMAFSEGNAITGDVAFDLVPAAAMAAGRALTGDVTHTLDVAADLVFSPAAYELAGEVAFTLTPAAALSFSDAEAIVGDVTHTLIPASAMSAALVHAIAGDVAFVFMSAGGMVFTAPVEISSPLLEQIAADLDAFFDLNAFAVPCRYEGTDFAGIFDAEALDAPGGEIAPALLLAKSTDVAEVAKGDTVRVDGVDHVVTGRLPDGTGLTRLVFSL